MKFCALSVAHALSVSLGPTAVRKVAGHDKADVALAVDKFLCAALSLEEPAAHVRQEADAGAGGAAAGAQPFVLEDHGRAALDALSG